MHISYSGPRRAKLRNMNATGNPLHRQKGAILPVVLLLGIGLMTGVAGVVNLGFVQDDLARAERAAMDSAISTQYLTDFQQIEISRLGQPRGAQIPFPTGGIFFASGAGADQSCFANGDRASTKLDFISRGWGEWGAGQSASSALNIPRTQPYTLGEVIPVFSSAAGVATQSANSYALTEYLARDIYYVTLGASANTRIELRRLDDTDVDEFFAHIWFRIPGLLGASLPIAVPIFTVSAASSGLPDIQWIAAASGNSNSGLSVTGTTKKFDMHVGLTIRSGSTGFSRPSAAVQLRSAYDEWHALSIWYHENTVWTQIRHRGEPENSPNVGEPQITSGPVGYTINYDGNFYIGGKSDQSEDGDFINTLTQPLDIATVRVWLEPNIVSASSVADSLFEMDTYRPGGFFDSTSGLPLALNEPASYVTFDSNNGLIPLDGGDLITSEWQPKFGQPVVIGDVTMTASSPEKIGGNPDSSEPLQRGGPPSPRHYYLYHSCDENGYQFVQRVRQYTRSASAPGQGAPAQQVEWLEE